MVIVPRTVFVENSFSRTIGMEDLKDSKRLVPIELRRSGFILTAGSYLEFPVTGITTTLDKLRSMKSVVDDCGLDVKVISIGGKLWIRMINLNKNHAVRIPEGLEVLHGNS